MPDDRDQPALPFEPATERLPRDRGPAREAHDAAPREVPMDALSSLLFEEFLKRSAASDRTRR
jgi:hypothetical protein